MQNYVLEQINLFVLGEIDIGVCSFSNLSMGYVFSISQATPTELGLVVRDLLQTVLSRPWRDAWVAVSL